MGPSTVTDSAPTWPTRAEAEAAKAALEHYAPERGWIAVPVDNQPDSRGRWTVHSLDKSDELAGLTWEQILELPPEPELRLVHSEP